jgi:hypothetical protein
MAVTVSIPAGLAYGADEPLPDMPVGMTVQDAAYHTVHGYPGGVAALAVRMGVSANTLTHKANPNNDTHHLRPDELVAMQALSGNYAVLHAMAAALGHVCSPAMPDQSEGDPVEVFMAQQRAQGEYSAALADAMLVEHPTPNAVRRVAAMAQDLIAKTGHQVAVLRGRMRKTPGGGL